MKTKLIGSLFVLALLLPGCGGPTITVQNESSYILDAIYVTPANVSDWGPDLTGGDVLRPGESITVDVGCDVYDIKVIDETGVECELHDVDVCAGEGGWVIDDVFLDACAFGSPARSGLETRHGHETEAAPATGASK